MGPGQCVLRCVNTLPNDPVSDTAEVHALPTTCPQLLVQLAACRIRYGGGHGGVPAAGVRQRGAVLRAGRHRAHRHGGYCLRKGPASSGDGCKERCFGQPEPVISSIHILTPAYPTLACSIPLLTQPQPTPCNADLFYSPSASPPASAPAGQCGVQPLPAPHAGGLLLHRLPLRRHEDVQVGPGCPGQGHRCYVTILVVGVSAERQRCESVVG